MIAEDTNTLWLVGSLTFVAGILLGAAINHILTSTGRGSNKLGNQLSDLQREFKEYQAEVGNHFNTTGHLINKLTETYRDLHAHMATAADHLCDDPTTQGLLNDALLASSAINAGKSVPRQSIKRPPPFEQPKDYAPKNKPDEQGLLAEGYGFETKPS